jgi:hypothetical protein
MESKIFAGVDQYDVDQKIWNWRNANPKMKITKTYPAEHLDLPLKTGAAPNQPKAPPADTISVKIEYEASN